MALKDGKKLVSRFWRIAQVLTLPLNRGTDEPRRKFEKMNDEIVGMLSFNAVGSEPIGREIDKVNGHDHVGPAPDRGGQDMPVIRIDCGFCPKCSCSLRPAMRLKS